jgi:hypothetical protein
MNNIHFDFPALMEDGRAYSSWQPSAVLTDQIRQRENIKTNWDYRAYLQKNADSIIAFDKTTACQQTGCPYSYTRSPTIQTQSDLKSAYLSRQELQHKMYPFIKQSSLN